MKTIGLFATSAVPHSSQEAVAVGHGLLIAAEHILCPMRLMVRFRPFPTSPADSSAYWYLWVSAAGAVGELRKRLCSHPKHRAAVQEHITSKNAGYLPTFGRLTAADVTGDLALAMCVRIRDKHWAHWDYDVSDAYIKHLRLDGNDKPIAESAGQYTIEDTGIPWARESWFLDLERQFSLTEANIISQTQAMMELQQSSALFAREVGIGLVASGTKVIKREIISNDGRSVNPGP